MATGTQSTSTATSDAPPRPALAGGSLDPDQLLLAAPTVAAFPTLRPIPVEELHPAAVSTSPPSATLAPASAPVSAGGDSGVSDEADLASPQGMPGGGGIHPNIPGGLMLTAETEYIPVNANRTSQSTWRKDAAGNDMVGLPAVRDFSLIPMRDLAGWDGVGEPPDGMPMADPDLKKMTASMLFGPPDGVFNISVTSQPGGGQVLLWADQAKTTPIGLVGTPQPDGTVVYSGTLPDYPLCDFYVEGLETSASQRDVTVSVTLGIYPPATQQLSVVPIITNMEVRPSNPNTVTLLRDPQGSVIGLNSGEQFPVNSVPYDTLKPGATFVARVWRPGVFGNAGFVQNITNVVQGDPAVVLTTNDYYVHYLRSGSYPILDYVANERGVPIYPTLLDNSVPDEQGLASKDTPHVGAFEFADLISSMDLTFQARLYTVWQFDDQSIYTLGTEDWQAVFKASRVNGVLTPDPASIVTAQPYVRSHQNPGTTAYPPSYNESTAFAPLV